MNITINILNLKNKKLKNILKEIYGLNHQQIAYVLNFFGYNQNILTNNINTNTLTEINEFITKNYIINKDLQYKNYTNYNFKKSLNTYKGNRLSNKLPCKGQNTHSNAKTAKKLNKSKLYLYNRHILYT